MSYYVGLEGLIGAGKTTAARYFKSKGWTCLEEPVDDNPVLDLFYKNMKAAAFELQMYFLGERWRLQNMAAYSDGKVVLDRTLPGDRVFAEMHYKLGNMTELQWKIYERFADGMLCTRPPFLLVYLDVSVETAIKRIHERGRESEKGITPEYLKDLKTGYEKIIDQIASHKHQWSCGVDVMRVNWDKCDLEGLYSQVAKRIPRR